MASLGFDAHGHEQYDIIVIGAGMAGISAARTILSSAPATKFTVLEATNRIGGRILDIPVPGEPLNPVCLGATWLHSTLDNPLYVFARENGLLEELPADSPDSSPEDSSKATEGEDDHSWFEDTWFCSNSPNPPLFMQPGGHMIPYNLVIRAFKFVQKQLTAAAERCGTFPTEDTSLASFVWDAWRAEKATIASGCNEEDLAMLEDLVTMRLQGECAYTGAGSPHELNVNWYGAYDLLDEDSNTPPKGGFSSLVEKIAEPVVRAGVVQLETAVTKIEKLDDMFVITCANGKRLNAKAVVSTASLAVLQCWITDGTLPSRFPSELSKAIGGMRLGRVEKYHLEYPSFWWRKMGKDFMGKAAELSSPTSVRSCGGFAFVPNVSHLDKVAPWYPTIVAAYEDRDPVLSPKPILTFWVLGGAAKALEEAAIKAGEDKRSFLQRELHAMMKDFVGPTDIPSPVGLYFSDWGSHPYIRGSYSFIPVGGSFDDLLRIQEGWVDGSAFLIAGEATHEKFYSTTQAAFLTGAAQALKALEICSK